MIAELRGDRRTPCESTGNTGAARARAIAARPTIFAVMLSLLLLVACDLSGAPATPTPDPLVQALARIPSARSVKIRDDWAGLSPAAPILAHYLLDRTADGLAGTAEFAVGESRGAPITTTVTIGIPEDVVKDFLAKVAAAPLKEGTYTPKIEHTDDYPNISVTIDVSGDVLSFYTQSQGMDHTPWAATINNKEYVIETAEIAEALRLLTPYLEGAVLDRLVEEASNR
jgi:hypothetical protein